MCCAEGSPEKVFFFPLAAWPCSYLRQPGLLFKFDYFLNTLNQGMTANELLLLLSLLFLVKLP